MESATPRTCAGCGASLDATALVCPGCQRLVHAPQLEELAAAARLHETRGELSEARDCWTRALQLLPEDSTQAAWVRDKAQRLAIAERARISARPAWVRRFGPLAPVLLLILNGKYLVALFKLKFLLSLGAFAAFYWAMYGAKFGIGFAVLILVHELGHLIDIRRRGLPAEMPVFLPGLGAYVKWNALGVTERTRAFVSLAGPMAGAIGAAVCVFLWTSTGDAFWVDLASISALLNLLNLIPIWVLDGGQTIRALNQPERITLACGALVFAVALRQPILLLVAGGAAYRAFTKDAPSTANRDVLLYYLLLVAALGFVVKLAPPLPPHT
jgi:Zn-dependent protease